MKITKNLKIKIGRKTILYSLDAALGLLYSLIIMSTIIGYFERSVYNRQASMQMYDLGVDSANVLHLTGAYQAFYSENEWFFNNSVYDKVTGFSAPIIGIGCIVEPRMIGKHFNNVLSMNGSVAYADIQTADTRDLLGSYDSASISVWIKQTNNYRNMTIFDDAWVNLTSRLQLSLDPSNHVVFRVTTRPYQSNRTYTTSSTVSFGVWHHVVAIVNVATDSLSVYLDKTLSNTTASPSFGTINFQTDSSLTTRIGSTASNTNPFSGQIDNLQLFNRALSYSDVVTLYGNDSVFTGLLAKYTFDGESAGLNSTLQIIMPVQYVATAELTDRNNRTIANIDIPDMMLERNTITSSERIVAVKNVSREMSTVLLAKLYLVVR